MRSRRPPRRPLQFHDKPTPLSRRSPELVAKLEAARGYPFDPEREVDFGCPVVSRLLK